MEDELLWYVAYGSNLSRTRLQRYLDRCDPVRGPVDRRVVRLPHRLFFADESKLWTGGTAFVDPSHDPRAGTLAVAWLIGRDQFRVLLALENGAPPDVEVIDHLPTGPGDVVAVEGSRYGLVVGCESPDHRPACTFTTPLHPLPSATVPATAYVDTIVAGLVDEHGLSDDEARQYLRDRGGFLS